MPLSAKTKAPPSKVHSLVTGSFWTLAVKPTALAPFPVVYTDLEKIFWIYFKNWDLAVPGSPKSNTLTSPRILCFPWGSFGTPPNNDTANAFLINSFPYIEGAIEFIIIFAIFYHFFKRFA